MARILRSGQDTKEAAAKDGGVVNTENAQAQQTDLEEGTESQETAAVGEKLGLLASGGVTNKEAASIEAQGGPLPVARIPTSTQHPGGVAGRSIFDEANMAKTRQDVAEETMGMSGADKVKYYFEHLAPNVADSHVLFGHGPLQITVGDIRNCIDPETGTQAEANRDEE